MKNILCFGDSNTFGAVPLTGGRFPYEVRWTGALQGILGGDYRVIEEGLNGRSTVYEDETSPGKSGLMMLSPLISSHLPLDLIILMLGTNDLKQHYHVTPADLGRAMRRLADEVLRYDYEPYHAPELLIVSPIYIESGVQETFGRYSEAAAGLSHSFASEYSAVARARGCHFFDAASVAGASREDHLHMDAASHRALAEALAPEILRIIG